MTFGAVVETLALAFYDDPVQEWLFPDPARRDAQLRVWWRWIIDNRPSHAEVRESPGHESASIWYGPDAGDTGRVSGFPDMLADLLGPAVAREKLEGLAVIPAAHPTVRHWYLGAIGTRPAHQGMGCGSRLLRPALARCDDASLPAYLESSNPRNLPFYERLGFAATRVIDIPGGPALTAMWRDPRPSRLER